MQKVSNTISQKDHTSKQHVDVEMMRSFHEAIDIPFRDVCDAVRPELKHEVDIGDGVGGLTTILNLIYSALLLQDEAAHAKAHDAEKKKKKRHSLIKKDISELQKYE
jgi:hypothetical protein